MKMIRNDDNGQMLTATSGRYGNTVLFDYDDAGRLTDETLALSSQSCQTETTYDAASRVQSLTYPAGSVVERTYNSRGQLHTVEWNGNVVDTRTYDPRGLLQQSTYGNGVVTDFGYRDDGLVQSIATTNAGSQKVGTYTYTYDANKNKTSETITGAGVMNDYGFGQAQTAYDSEDRLTGWNRDDNQQNQTWQLSPVGDWNQFNENNQATAFVHNGAHELTSVGNQGINYDASGNQLQTAAGIGLTWDQENRLTAAGNHSFEYDALGRRVSIDDSAGTKVLVCAGQQLIATYAAGAPASSPNQNFVYGSYIDEPILLENGSQRYYFSRNQQFSVTALTDNAGAVVERYAYDAYGNTLILSDNGTARTASDLDNPFTFTGRYLHPEIDLLYFRARFYEPATGRFIGRDPLQYVDGMSLYRAYFVPGEMDPSGLDFIPVVREFTPSQINSIVPDSLAFTRPTIVYGRDAPQNIPGNVREDVIEEFNSPGCPDCHCARVSSAESIHLIVNVALPFRESLLEQPGGWSAGGYDAIVGHENRRLTVYRLGYEAYLARAQGAEALRCGLVCSETPGRARSELEEYLNELRTTAERLFDSYTLTEQTLIELENSLKMIGDRVDENGNPFVVLDGFWWTHTVNTPPAMMLPDCPESDCFPDSVNPI